MKLVKGLLVTTLISTILVGSAFANEDGELTATEESMVFTLVQVANDNCPCDPAELAAFNKCMNKQEKLIMKQSKNLIKGAMASDLDFFKSAFSEEMDISKEDCASSGDDEFEE